MTDFYLHREALERRTFPSVFTPAKGNPKDPEGTRFVIVRPPGFIGDTLVAHRENAGGG